MAAVGAIAGFVALGGAGAASAAQAASMPAAASGNVSVQPGSVAPGGQVSVYGLSCVASTGMATSPAFAANIPLSMLSNSTGGVGAVSSSAKPGTYPVTVTCGSMTLTGSVTVTRTSTGTGGTSTVPKGGAATGDGASLISGSSDGAVETGACLALAGVGLGLIAMRRRRAHTDH